LDERDRVNDLLARWNRKECDLSDCLEEIDSFTMEELLRLAAELQAQDEHRVNRSRRSAADKHRSPHGSRRA
jgi:hypothetical protein